MSDKIRAYIEDAFADVPESRKSRELKDELYANLILKYKDQMEAGKGEDESVRIALSSIGDINELVESVKVPSPLRPVSEAERRRGAFLVATAVMMYILSVLPVIGLSVLGFDSGAGVILMFLMIAGATGIIIYHNMSKPVYQRTSDTVVEDFKEWSGTAKRRHSAYKSIWAAFWSMVVALYLILSFLTGQWHITWIIFIIAAAVQNIIKGVVGLKGGNRE